VNFDSFGHYRSHRWIFILGAVLIIWLSFGSQRRDTVVSTWSGETMRQEMLPPVPPAPLSGLFAKSAPRTSGLADLPQDPDLPWGNPTDNPGAVMTQGYGVGTHAPAPVWGAIDIAIDGNGDGRSDPHGSDGAPIYATHSGIVEVTPNSVPAGNHIWVRGERYKTGYSHLKAFAVETGQVVTRGTIIGYMGSTGQSSGPHLDYQVWEDGVNKNPLDFGALP
jgi:murein DD-endopeptidase MepM/ murein hydrolase activator NlpD